MTPWENNLNPITMIGSKKKDKTKNREDVARHRMKNKKVRKIDRLDVIYQICVQEFGDLSGEEKGREIFIKRTIYAKIAKELTDGYLTEIGARMGRKHCTVINQLNRFETDVKGHLKAKYEHLLEKCKSAIESYN